MNWAAAQWESYFVWNKNKAQEASAQFRYQCYPCIFEAILKTILKFMQLSKSFHSHKHSISLTSSSILSSEVTQSGTIET